MLKVATVSPNEPYREYKDVERVYSGSTEIDKILDKNGNVLFAVNKEVEGTPPLAYKGKEETNLKNYRIYGQTVDGESVGDRTGNLFDMSTIVENKYISSSGIETSSNAQYQENKLNHTDFINVSNDTAYSLTCVTPYSIAFDNTIAFCWFDDNESFISRDTKRINDVNLSGYSFSAISPLNATYLIINFIGYVDETTYMLNEGSTALPYEPFGYKVPVTVEGKNLLPNTATSQTKNGVTFTVNGDGSIFCNGQASPNNADLVNPDFLLPSGTYILTGCPDGGSDRETYKILIYVNGAWCANDRGSGANFTLTKTSTVSVRIAVYAGYTCDNLTFYPMIRRADITDDTYEPYHAPVTIPIYLPEQIKMVGDEAEYIDYEEQKQHRVRANYLQSSDFEAGAIYTGPNYINRSYKNSKTSPGEFNFYSTRKRSTKLITISGTYTISIADGWEFGIVMFPNDKNSGEPFIYNTEPVTISNCTFAIQIRKADISDISSADISDYKIMLNKGSTALPYEPYIENTELDVTLPALPTLSGTNTLTVGTEVQPSNVYLKGRIKEIA